MLTPLFARIFCFPAGAASPVALVSADLIWWDSERMEAMRRGIRAHDGLSKNATIVLHATHNHSGPQTSQVFSALIGEASPAYLEMLENTIYKVAAVTSGRVG